MFEVRRTRTREHRSELRPSIRRAHVDDADRLDSWLWRFDTKQSWRLAALYAAPELALRGDDEMLIERVGMGRNLHPLAAPGDHRKHRRLRRRHPHIVLQLRHIFLG